MANMLTCCRIAGSLFLLFIPAFSAAFFILYLICGITDMIDGPIARKTNTSGEFGAKLDTVADFIFAAVCLGKLLPLMPIPPWLWLWTAFIAVIKAINIISGLVCWQSLPAEHTVLNKITGFLLFLLPLTCPLLPLPYTAAAVCLTATFAALQEGHLIRTKHRPT